MSKFNRHNTRSAKLSATDVYNIRQRYTEGESQGSLAREFQVTVGTIGRIVRGESWQAFAPQKGPSDVQASLMRAIALKEQLEADGSGMDRFAAEAARLPTDPAKDIDDFIHPKAAVYLGKEPTNDDQADDKGDAGGGAGAAPPATDPNLKG
jgi:hypothetical protein